MIEIIALSMLAAAVLASVFPSLQQYNAAKLAKKIKIPDDSVLKRHFLTHLRNENQLLAAELEKRIAKAG